MHIDHTYWKTGGSRLTLREKVGQLFMPAAFINDSEAEIARLENLISTEHIGGICFFHSRASAATNYEGKKEIPYHKDSFESLKRLIARYQHVAKYPLIIAIDAEWGLAMRIENTPQYPYALTLGALPGHTNLIYQVGRQIGSDCRVAGIHWNFAPVADINNNPDNPVIGYRSFGNDKHRVAKNAVAFSKGLQSQGILTSAKHFPGHGDTATDSHLGLPVIDKSLPELKENELWPFRELIKSGVDSVMIGHLAVPGLAGDHSTPATLSEKMVRGLLREYLGFNGVVVSDALNMHAVSKRFKVKGELEYQAFTAGIDLLCFSENPREGIQKILDKGDPREIEASFSRMWKLKSNCHWRVEGSATELSDPHPLNLQIAQKCITEYRGSTPCGSLHTKSLTGIQIGRIEKNLFFEKLRENGSLGHVHVIEDLQDLPVLENEGSDRPVLLSIFPPSVKPAGSFGFSDIVLEWIRDTLNRHDVILYLFGNPYFLNLLDLGPRHRVVIAYQDFDAFQEVAADHFLGNCEVCGSLPVQLS